MKPATLLTTAIFLLSAPWPDSETLSELSAGFLSSAVDRSMLTSDTDQKSQTNPDASTLLVARPVTEEIKRVN